MANEKRLIDANALPFTTLTDGGCWTVDVVYKRDILNAATVDAVEVCFCKDCKHYDGKICSFHSEWPDQYNTGHTAYMEPNDFCSYGEKREVE